MQKRTINPELRAAGEQPAWRHPILQSDAETHFLAANEANASLDPGVGLYTSIAVDGNDYVHISYYDAINKDLKYATNVSGQWVTAVVNSTGTVGKYTSIDVDSSNKPHISYFDNSNTNLKYAYLSGTSWKKETVPGGAALEVGLYTSIVLDDLNRPHISYYDYTNGDPVRAQAQRCLGPGDSRQLQRCGRLFIHRSGR